MLPNPVTAAYQYFTCANMSAMDLALPGRPITSVAEVRDQLGSLFTTLRQARRSPERLALR